MMWIGRRAWATTDEEMDMALDRAAKRKDFNRVAVDAVEEAVGVVIDPAPPEKPKDAIEPGSEGGLRRGKVGAKRLPAKKRKRTPFL